MRRHIALSTLALLGACVQLHDADVADDSSPLAAITVTPGTPSARPADQLAPPGSMVLSTSDAFVLGSTVSVTVQSAPASSPVFLIGSIATRGTQSCPPQLAPVCLDLFTPIAVLGTTTSDAAGTGVFSLSLPTTLPLRTAHLQAASRTGGRHTSNVLDVPFEAPMDTDTDTDTTPPNLCLARVDFEATIATVTGSPFGSSMAVLRTTPVAGFFQYDICVPDSDTRAEVGTYDHPANGDFSATLHAIGVTVTGSPRPVVTVEDFPTSNTFRYADGPQFADPTIRTMSANGLPNADLETWLSITDSSGTVFASPAPPATFPFVPIASFPHTFYIDDGNGRVQMQMTSVTQTLTPQP
ncbi:MAG: hypothetical protein H6733_06460 [Alphaproteobacteria bacterium]|nr:hypothetical protein [Alphaproteobacteria bacterium]